MCMYIPVYVYAYVHMYMCICIYVYVYVCVYVHVCVYASVFLYVYVKMLTWPIFIWMLNAGTIFGDVRTSSLPPWLLMHLGAFRKPGAVDSHGCTPNNEVYGSWPK